MVTGFDPFGGDKINPALEAVKKLDGRKIDDIAIVAVEVPTVFHESIKAAVQAIERHQPAAVICVGQAGGRTQITPERVAINIDDARIPDNRGNQPVDEPIVPAGPAAYWSRLPIKRMVQEMHKAGIPAAVSNTAGTFVCNHLFYGIMDYLERRAPQIRGGFVHIPYLPEQTLANHAPSLSLEMIVRGLEICAVTAAHYEADVHAAGGAIS